jgi:hypothetical protein
LSNEGDLPIVRLNAPFWCGWRIVFRPDKSHKNESTKTKQEELIDENE